MLTDDMFHVCTDDSVFTGFCFNLPLKNPQNEPESVKLFCGQFIRNIQLNKFSNKRRQCSVILTCFHIYIRNLNIISFMTKDLFQTGIPNKLTNGFVKSQKYEKLSLKVSNAFYWWLETGSCVTFSCRCLWQPVIGWMVQPMGRQESAQAGQTLTHL